MKITAIKYYGGARDKIARLGLAHLFLELQQIILDTPIFLLEEKDKNGAAVVREAIDKKFEKAENWENKKTGGIDWKKQHRYNQSMIARIGVELQVSARSDLVVRDLVHLRNVSPKAKLMLALSSFPLIGWEGFCPIVHLPCGKPSNTLSKSLGRLWLLR